MAILPSSSAPLNSSYAGTGSSPLPSVARTRGRRTGTRRPPKVTDPASVPCRVAVRSGSCLPFRPHAEVTSACINCCMTCSPAPTARASKSLAHVGSDLLHRDPDMVGHGKCRRVGHGRLILLGHSGPLSLGVLGGSPETYHPVGLGRGTATSSSTRPGTTSDSAADLVSHALGAEAKKFDTDGRQSAVDFTLEWPIGRRGAHEVTLVRPLAPRGQSLGAGSSSTQRPTGRVDAGRR